jgi:hypothetical protein
MIKYFPDHLLAQPRLLTGVVILVGIDTRAAKHPETLYVGASRARAMLYVLALDGVALS